jgi:hypothetical protein
MEGGGTTPLSMVDDTNLLFSSLQSACIRLTSG